ncbi:hypothetical protein ACFL6E_00480 [Candidatus Neomarinimicrobiota bacterium]
MVDMKGSSKGKTGVKGVKKGSEDKKALTNHDVVRERLQKLSLPILDRYGESAFDELLARLETTIEEFTGEFETLFTEMIDQSRDDYRRLQNLLAPDESVEAVDEEEKADTSGDEMSEFERKLEEMEQEKITASE